MDAETIKREASWALQDLELEATVSNVTHSGGNWCVHFDGDYGQFCDSFKNQFEHDNSPRVIREKIKKHLLAQITQLRNKGGRKTTRKAFEDERPNVTELLQEAVSETTRAIGNAIDRTLGVTGTTIKTAGDLAETVTARAAEMVQPAPRTSRPALPRTESPKLIESTARKTTGKVKRAAGTRKSAVKGKRAPAKKKAAAKKSTRKR